MNYYKPASALRFTLLLMIAAWAVGCDKPPESLPPEMLKVWRSSAPAYKDRYLEIREDFLIFGTGKYSISMHPIRHVESVKKNAQTHDYMIEYTDRVEETFHLRVSFTDGRKPKLRLDNHKEVWVPEVKQPEET